MIAQIMVLYSFVVDITLFSTSFTPFQIVGALIISFFNILAITRKK